MQNILDRIKALNPKCAGEDRYNKYYIVDNYSKTNKIIL